MRNNIMEFRHVSQQFGDNVVLRDIDFEVEAGKFYTLLGPSGSGKTTILRLTSQPAGRSTLTASGLMTFRPTAARLTRFFKTTPCSPT